MKSIRIDQWFRKNTFINSSILLPPELIQTKQVKQHNYLFNEIQVRSDIEKKVKS
jgi:hypothetical protein